MSMDKSVWDELLNYESRGLVAREYVARHPQWKEIRTKEIASEVCATLRQARSYFVSARDADAAIKPLLLYYGALGLARGLILFTGHKAREATLDPRHGLTPKGWANELATEGGSIQSLSVSLDSCGTFRELVSAVSNRTLVRFNSSAVQWSCGHKPLAEETRILRFGDLIQRTPAVAAFARRWLQLPPCFLGVHSIVNADGDAGSFTLKVTCSEAERDRMTAIFGSVPWTVVSSDATFVDIRFDAQNAHPYTWSDIETLRIGTAFLIEDFGGFQLCQIAAVFVIAYVLGMLARYHPSHWTALIRNEKHDVALPTVQALISHVEDRFPAMVLDFLESNSAKPS